MKGQTSSATVRFRMENPQKKKNLETELPHNPATALLGVHLKESKSAHHRDSLSTTGEKLSTLPRGKASQPDAHQLQTDTAGVLFGRKEECNDVTSRKNGWNWRSLYKDLGIQISCFLPNAES